jgi:PIN domain nuclease of toxin-antitoxin system
LPISLRRELDDARLAPIFSIISIWEIAVKATKHADFQIDARLTLRTLIESGWRELILDGEHAIVVGQLPHLHGDPFDRALLAQAMFEQEEFVTADPKLADYGEFVRTIRPLKRARP